MVVVYLLVVAITYLPLLVAAAQIGLGPLWRHPSQEPLTFLQDWGLNYALLVSLPSMVVLLVSDEQVLATSLDEVQRDGVIGLSESDANALRGKWVNKFRIWNLSAQLGGIVVGAALGVFTLRSFLNGNISLWIGNNSDVHFAAYVYLYCISLLYAMVIIYVSRCIAISLFLRAVVAGPPLQILPLHPDKCGGLRPIGRLGLRNQYTLTILGINIVLLLVVWIYFKEAPPEIKVVMVGGTLAYLILGPIIFMAPLLPFRAGMLEAKKKWTHEVARVVRVEIERLRVQISKNEVSKHDEEALERLRKVGGAIDELPIWPFDPGTLRKFAAAYIVPLALPLLGQLAHAILKVIGH